MTSACLTLLQRVNCPIWPWDKAGEARLLVEAFPMAQLHQWGLPYERYNGESGHAANTREQIISGILPRLDLGEFISVLKENADALDAVLCAFAPIAVVTNNIAVPPDQAAISEGWIAIHS